MRGLLFSACLAGCNVFDERLYLEADAGAVDSGPPPVTLGEDCTDDDVPIIDEFNVFLDSDTTSLRNDYFELATCLGRNATGNDGFFAIDMVAGQKWHFHVKVTPGSTMDPAVYVLSSACDPRECGPGEGLNECISGQDEHFSFVPPSTGRFFVGVDNVSGGGEALQVLAVRPVCGNDEKEHSESCDDGNTTPGDGCDETCRTEIPNPVTTLAEVEPNDEPFVNANVVDVTGGPITVTGQLGSKCDFDSFAIEVPEGGGVLATMTTPGGSPCGGTAPDFRISLRAPDGFTERGHVDGGGCPSLGAGDGFAQTLTAGRYFVRITTVVVNEPDVFDYGLTLEAVSP